MEPFLASLAGFLSSEELQSRENLHPLSGEEEMREPPRFREMLEEAVELDCRHFGYIQVHLLLP